MLIILLVIVCLIILDTTYALIFSKSPILKIRENNIDKGLLVNHYNCSNKEEKTLFKSVKYSCPLEEDMNFYQCLENELNNYMSNNLTQIPITDIQKDNLEKITYYKGVYDSNNPNNMYVIIYPLNGTYEATIMNNYYNFFSDKYPLFQAFESSYSPTIFSHNDKNDIDFENILNKCRTNNNESGKKISGEMINKLQKTQNIVIKVGDKELGTISDSNKIEEILNIFSTSKQYGNTFLCDNYSFNFEMYDDNHELIDTIYVWYDGKRVVPKSMSKGCFYYSIENEFDLRKIIERETDYTFYDILNMTNNDNQKLELIYQDEKNNYYVNADDPNNILIKFTLNNQIMTLKNALLNKNITPEKVSNDYPEILIKKEKI